MIATKPKHHFARQTSKSAAFKGVCLRDPRTRLVQFKSAIEVSGLRCEHLENGLSIFGWWHHLKMPQRFNEGSKSINSEHKASHQAECIWILRYKWNVHKFMLFQHLKNATPSLGNAAAGAISAQLFSLKCNVLLVCATRCAGSCRAACLSTVPHIHTHIQFSQIYNTQVSAQWLFICMACWPCERVNLLPVLLTMQTDTWMRVCIYISV